MDNFTYQDMNDVLEEFVEFMVENKKSTKDLYVDIIKEYLLNEVCNVVDKNDYECIFSQDKIIDFKQNYRRSAVVGSALNKLKEYFIKKGKLEKGFIFEFDYTQKKEKKEKVIIPFENIQNIVLGNQGIFRNEEEKIITQCMSAISYHCIFEQKHISMLKCTDILLKEQRIRNVRIDNKDAKDVLVKWIYIEEPIMKYILAYVEYFKIDMISNELFFKKTDGEEFDNTHQNNLFKNYYFKANNFLKINPSNLNYSRIYHYLVATKGKGAADVLQIVGFSNEQLKYAMEKYISDYGFIDNPNNTLEFLSIGDISEKYVKALENCENEVNLQIEEEIIEDENESEWVTVCNLYSEENDISMDDVILYDSMSQNNQKNKNVELSRLIRSTSLAESLKRAYNNCCQLCGTRLMKTKFEAYSEAHHIRPYNKTHKGDDTIRNMIVLCPNCHSQFDNLYYAIHPNTRLVHCLDEEDRFHKTRLEFMGIHELDEKYLTYTWKLFKSISK